MIELDEHTFILMARKPKEDLERHAHLGVNGATRDARRASRFTEFDLDILTVRHIEGEINLLGPPEWKSVLCCNFDDDIEAMHPGNRFSNMARHDVAQLDGPSTRSVNERQDRYGPLL
jgi:hypothetical protein